MARKYCNGYTPSLENDNLPDSYKMMKHDRLSATFKCEPPKISQIANEKINALNDSIPSLCYNGTFGGSAVFDNVLANSPKMSNKCKTNIQKCQKKSQVVLLGVVKR